MGPAQPYSRRAVLLGRQADPPRRVAAIAPACLALHGTACMSCRDACSTGAIRFALALGGAQPLVQTPLCTGCGACIAPCPAGAIALVEAERPHA
jgi:ferredoxin-type protein NapF